MDRNYQTKLRKAGLKKCCRCLGEFKFEEFRRTSKDILSHKCHKCELVVGTEQAAGRGAYYQANRDSILRKRVGQRLLTRYGITEEDYEKKLLEQGGHCALCPKTPTDKRLHVDHNHQTGKVRGLLCYSCNTRVGVIENAKWMRLAEEYLRNWGED